jgi:hypothetical protein
MQEALILDGWTNIAKNSMYAFMVFCGDQHDILDVRECPQKDIPPFKFSVLEESRLNMNKVYGLCTDYPSVVISF